MDIRTNTPMRNPPEDYCPSGSEHWFTIVDGYDAGKTIFYADTQVGPHEPETTVLFVHGNPENTYTFRHIRDHLIRSGHSFRIVAPDHIGFGLSDQADYEMSEMHHASNLLQLVRHLNLNSVFLVVHDWGGPIGIGALLNDADRVNGLCVLNTSVFPMPSDSPTYKNYPFPWAPWHLTPYFIPDSLWGGVAAALVPGDFDPQKASGFLPAVSKGLWRYWRGEFTPEQPEYVWSSVFASKANVRSSKQFVRQTANWGVGLPYTDKKHGRQDNRPFYSELQARVAKLWGAEGANIPGCLHFGEWDALAKDSVIAQWHNALPSLAERTTKYARTGHFVEEQKGPEIGQSIIEISSAISN